MSEMTPPTISTRPERVDRRTVLKTAGAVLAGSAVLSGRGGAQPSFPPNNKNTTTTFGESLDFDGDSRPDLWTYATTHENGTPLQLGIWISGTAFDAITSSPGDDHYYLDFPAVRGLNYTFAGINWNPHGHPPGHAWGVPHFDFHYYFVERSAVTGITDSGSLPFIGVADYDVPDQQFPRNYVYEDPRFIVRAMGEHLYNEKSPEFRPNGEFTHTYIYGVYDPTIDLDTPSGTVALPVGPGGAPIDLPVYTGTGQGELTFTEPMITQKFLESEKFQKKSEVRATVETPDVFPEAGYYPTSYVMRYRERDDAYVITLEDMAWFDADTA